MNAEKYIIKLGILFSLILHVGIAVWLFTTKIPTSVLDVRERVITVKTVANVPVVFPTLTPPHKKKAELFVDKTTVAVNSDKKKTDSLKPEYPVTTPTEKSSLRNTGKQPGIQDMQNYLKDFSLAGTKEHPLLKHKPDFLIQGRGGRRLLIPDIEGVPRDQGLGSVYSFSHLYGGLNYLAQFPIGPLGGEQEYDGYKQGTGRIDFNVKGLNISPWAKMVVNKIQLNWSIPPGLMSIANTSLTVGVQVTFEKSGSISSSRIKQSSKIEALDKAVLSALTVSAPFPLLPEEFPDQTLVAYLRFNVNNYD